MSEVIESVTIKDRSVKDFRRLEDFIRLAAKGINVHVSIELKKQAVIEKIHPQNSPVQKNEMDMYLLVGVYSFQVGEEVKKISKVYLFGSAGEHLEAYRINKHIANERLKMDYKRLRQANIILEEKYF